jgi:hypothetical protein
MRIRWREFELPNRVVRDEAVSNSRYGLFVAEPFEPDSARPSATDCAACCSRLSRARP